MPAMRVRKWKSKKEKIDFYPRNASWWWWWKKAELITIIYDVISCCALPQEKWANKLEFHLVCRVMAEEGQGEVQMWFGKRFSCFHLSSLSLLYLQFFSLFILMAVLCVSSFPLKLYHVGCKMKSSISPSTSNRFLGVFINKLNGLWGVEDGKNWKKCEIFVISYCCWLWR